VTAKTKGKKARKWGEDGVYEADGNDILDFSSAPESAAPLPPVNIDNLIGSSQSSKFEIDDDDDIDNAPQTKSNRGWGIFSNFVGGKVLTKDDLKDPLEQMHQFLLAKNVANEVSIHLCESVEKSLVGQKTGNFQSSSSKLIKLTVGTKNSVRKAIDDSLTRILTPTKSTDLLHEITTVRKQEKRPYTISFVGVNGVGKSTNLSKIAFKLLNNGNSILIAACDTFRSGAVEQLRKHVVNLNQWVERNAKDKVKIELFERGYGRDAAEVAAHAVKFAGSQGFDVVLIDTAGRRHNDQALMGSLGKVSLY
jgi:signal recognition particle receptor subunit alpha